MAEPMVSITVCVRNGAHWIQGCLESLKDQTYRSFEILVVNDGSTDDAEAVLDTYHDPEGINGVPLRVHHQPPLGLSAGRQWAVEHARGEWVAITDIDVRPEPDWIAFRTMEHGYSRLAANQTHLQFEAVLNRDQQVHDAFWLHA